jgi:uroporphyrinogen-III synthase
MRILITRPLPDAETTAAELQRRGHEAVQAPMLITRFTDWTDSSVIELPDAVVATSPNGVRGLAGHPDFAALSGLPLFVTGDATARLAVNLGFRDVRSARGDASGVAARLGADVPIGSLVLYGCGHDVSRDLAGDLASRGYRVHTIELYRALAATELPQPAIEALSAGKLDAILIFSARTAETLLAAIVTAGLLAVSRPIPIHAISQQAAEPLRAAGFSSIIVASRPDAAELLDTLETCR